MINVTLCKSYEDAALVANTLPRVVAIETEYGDDSLNTSHKNVEVALNHHGKFQVEDAPALSYKKFNNQQQPYDNFIVSHIDLDVLFGLLWAGGWLKETPTTIQLSKLVADADVNGFHKVFAELGKVPEHIRDKYLVIGYLINSWIITDDGLSRKDISREVHKLLLKIKDIIIGKPTTEQLEQVRSWLAQQEASARKHLQKIKHIGDDILLEYRAPFSLTTAYNLNDLRGDIIVQYHEEARSISMSCFNEDVAIKHFGKKGVIEPLQKFFNKSAGGKVTIGGSPRDIDLQPEVMVAFTQFLDREYFNIPGIDLIA